MKQETVNALWGNRLTWDELSTLAVCLALDLLDYLVPFMMTPIYGDLLDLTGIAFAFIFFNTIGAITILELVPGLDILPLFTITWITWYINTSKVNKKRTSEQLERWR